MLFKTSTARFARSDGISIGEGTNFGSVKLGLRCGV